MIDTCTRGHARLVAGVPEAIAVILLLALGGCATGGQSGPPPKPVPPYAACLPRPVPLPQIATVEQLRARHDRLDTLYTDCAARLRANLDATR